ncbi:signal peptidase II [Buchananella hordeovulneris]|uniref:Lipoprotein signal peptidase n=1 Tax=Buchananella hordeovulneris TaxID=52770 RepID=A0A1Q5PVM1_9ACTO|nr:signal peptidase II [Buchananella hordeovulneris]MDO5080597.1 signal peptidase II [Buchananella hordeovulneris]OKL51522.1 hypothetical protein BSZ40_06655 [Buchananella hordeovulneris]RRD44091.1 signal peptidase II [Buchananella hordeovulneris]RRD53652.1 signal peptidase II [Buchananella hordeovulneris]
MHATRPRHCVTLLGLAALGVYLADQASKWWAVRALRADKSIDLLGSGWLGLELHFNPGAAFSFATGLTWVFAVVAIVVSLYIVRLAPRLRSRAWAVVLGLFLGGTLGNLTDRLVRPPGPLRGHVVDFIRYGDWFIGNVADIALVLAAVGLAALALANIEPTGPQKTEAPTMSAAPDAAQAAQEDDGAQLPDAVGGQEEATP